MVASSEGITIDDESLHVIAHKADGAMRDALTIFDQTVAFCGTDVKYQDVLRNLNVLDYEYSFSLVDAFLKGDYPAALMTFDEVLTKGFNALHFVAALSSHLRDLVVSKSGGLDALLELPESLKIRYKEQADRCSLGFLYEGLSITTQCESGYRASVNPRLHIEFALMRLSFIASKPAVAAAPAAVSAPAQGVKTPTATQNTGEMLRSSESPRPAQAPAPAETAPVAAQNAGEMLRSPEQSQPAPAEVQAALQPAGSDEQPRERRTRGARVGMSLKSVMDEPQAEAAAARTEDTVPSDETVKAKWPELARMYSDKPRLASMLTTTTLEMSEADGFKTVVFFVVNDAQKDWVESKLLHELEGNFRKVVGSAKVYLRVAVSVDDTPEEKKIYMPSDQAAELMRQNEQVKNLVKDLELDIK
jgi:DNA polymerase-3 subunit gamma/tau